jgi:hypothetical protein
LIILILHRIRLERRRLIIIIINNIQSVESSPTKEPSANMPLGEMLGNSLHDNANILMHQLNTDFIFPAASPQVACW